MIPELRREFNARFTPERYGRFLERLDHRVRTRIGFRVCETPVFVPRDVQMACEEAAVELTLQAHDPAYLARSEATLEPRYTVAGQPPRSTFMTVDFAMTPGPDGSIAPKLIELQGFPSLMGFQLAYAELSQEHWHLPSELGYINGGHSRPEYLALLREAIVADEDPEQVVLLDYDPMRQKTNPDFFMTQELLGIGIADIRELRVDRGRLSYERDGRWIPIRRIYNRAIVDELDRAGVAIPFDWSDDLDVAWAGHPNWYFRISKYTLPFLEHPTVPPARFLDEIDELPEELDRFVLKPLYSFAGVGVVVGPTREEIESIPHDRRGGYLLQERIDYLEAVVTPAGGTKAELRIMLIWPDGAARPTPVMGLVRLGRGRMMGVDYNRNMEWIGAGCNFYEL